MKVAGTKIEVSVLLLAISGVLLLVSLPLIAGGSFTVWFAAKALFGVGVVLFLLNK